MYNSAHSFLRQKLRTIIEILMSNNDNDISEMGLVLDFTEIGYIAYISYIYICIETSFYL